MENETILSLFFLGFGVYFAVVLTRGLLGYARFHRDGVWADAGFLPWERIRHLAFRESPDLVLILLPRGGAGSFRLPVPRGEYGAVRKLIEEKIRAQVLNVEAGILGL